MVYRLLKGFLSTDEIYSLTIADSEILFNPSQIEYLCKYYSDNENFILNLPSERISDEKRNEFQVKKNYGIENFKKDHREAIEKNSTDYNNS